MDQSESSLSGAEPSPGTEALQSGKTGSWRRRRVAAALAVASLILGLVGLALGIIGAVTGRSTGSIGASCPPSGLQSPSAYVAGSAEIPDGQYLFVEWWRAQVQSSPDGCQLYFDEPTYSGGSEHLVGQISRGSGSGPVKGFWGAGHSSQGRECGAFSELTSIRSFPFVAPAAAGISEGDIVIQRVDASGAIVVEVKGCTVWIEPDQSWEDQEYENQVASFYRLTNYGLLDESQTCLEGLRAPVVVPPGARMTCTQYQPTEHFAKVLDIEVAPDGNVWIATRNGVARFDTISGQWIKYGTTDGLVSPEVGSITAEPDGTVWVAYSAYPGVGVSHFDGESWTQVTVEDGLISDSVRKASIAPDGSVWFATADGVSHWDRSTDVWARYRQQHGLHASDVADILFTPDGKVWFADSAGVTCLVPASTDGEREAWYTHQELCLDYQPATTSADGRIWFGGQRFYDPNSQEWVDTVYDDHAVDLAVDESGGLWIATWGGAIFIPDPLSSPDEEWRRYGTPQGLADDEIRSVALESENIIWFGTKEATVSRCIIETDPE